MICRQDFSHPRSFDAERIGMENPLPSCVDPAAGFCIQTAELFAAEKQIAMKKQSIIQTF
jgi:hypothetical protein